MPFPTHARNLSLAALVGVGGASVAAWLAPLGWPFELFAHFRMQLAVAAALLVPALLLVRSPRAALLAGALAAVHFAPGAQRLLADAPARACGGPAFVVVTANVQFSNPDHQRFMDWLAAHPADFVVVQEVTAEWARSLGTLRDYPYRRLLTREDPYGIAVLSRWPFESAVAVDLAGDGRRSFDTVALIRGRRVHLLGLHTRWPITPELARDRDRALLRAAAMARSQSLPTVAIGDLNLTPDSPAFAQLLHDSGLRDAFADRGWHPTWMAGFWPLALRIDHALVSSDVCVEHAEVGPEIGSDHRPVIAQLRLESATPRTG
jgi:endonuclease/exonuclease/phosphatase (EEP) superfamily protein YafD